MTDYTTREEREDEDMDKYLRETMPTLTHTLKEMGEKNKGQLAMFFMLRALQKDKVITQKQAIIIDHAMRRIA